jgi:hypothetical protein
VPFVLVPPQVSSVGSTRSVPCSMRCTGRPRPIPNDDSPQRHRRRTQAPPGLAGEIEHRR